MALTSNSGTPNAPIIRDAQPPENAPEPVSIKRLWGDYVAGRRQAGFMRDGGKRQGVAIESLRKFVKHDDARRTTKKDMLAWRDFLLLNLSARTVSDIYLSTARTLFRWAVDNDRLSENPADTVKQPKPRSVRTREAGYTYAEAVKLLKASRAYVPHADDLGRIREMPELTAAKRWVPIICAFTGARVSEITQLRKEDIQEIDGHWVVRITPEAGTVNTGAFRDVPLHPQIINEGFEPFVSTSNRVLKKSAARNSFLWARPSAFGFGSFGATGTRA